MDIQEIVSACKEADTFVWDLDGTLIDSFREFTVLFNQILISSGRQSASLEILQKNYHGTFHESVKNILLAMGERAEEATIAELVKGFHRLEEEQALSPDETIFEDSYCLALELQRLRKCQILVTNRFHGDGVYASPRTIVANSRLSPLIHHIVCSDETEYRKPDPRVLSNITEPLGKCVIIGDQHIDVELANCLEAPVIFLRRPGADSHLDKVHIRPEETYMTSSLFSLATHLASR